jgi:predicted metal-dependent phosphoesterase TrpH
MSDLLQEIDSQSEGASFHRGDLHIHSFGIGGSYDVTDSSMTPQAIIDAAVQERLEVVSIADHNSIGNVEAAIQYSRGKPLLIVPGVELSTSHGHLLCYFPDFAGLTKFFGRITISEDRRSCSETLAQCLALADQFGGFGILCPR